MLHDFTESCSESNFQFATFWVFEAHSGGHSKQQNSQYIRALDGTLHNGLLLVDNAYITPSIIRTF
jgi:hypothetical protein